MKIGILNVRRCKKIAEFRGAIVAQENAYFMKLMDDTAILLNNIQIGENIANEEAAQAHFEEQAQEAVKEWGAQAHAEAQAEAVKEWGAQAREAWEQFRREEGREKAYAEDEAQAQAANNLFRPALIAIPNAENELLRRREEQRERRQLRREYKYDEM